MSKYVTIRAYSTSQFAEVTRYVSCPLYCYDNNYNGQTIQVSGTTPFSVTVPDLTVYMAWQQYTEGSPSQAGAQSGEVCGVPGNAIYYSSGMNLYVDFFPATTYSLRATLDGNSYTPTVGFYITAAPHGSSQTYCFYSHYGASPMMPSQYTLYLRNATTLTETCIRIDNPYSDSLRTYIYTSNAASVTVSALDKDGNSWTGTLSEAIPVYAQIYTGVLRIGYATSLPTTFTQYVPSGTSVYCSGSTVIRGPQNQIVATPSPSETFSTVVSGDTIGVGGSGYITLQYAEGMSMQLHVTLDGQPWSGDIAIELEVGTNHYTYPIVTVPYTLSGLARTSNYYRINYQLGSTGPCPGHPDQGYAKNSYFIAWGDPPSQYPYGYVFECQLDFVSPCTGIDWIAYVDGVETELPDYSWYSPEDSDTGWIQYQGRTGLPLSIDNAHAGSHTFEPGETFPNGLWLYRVDPAIATAGSGRQTCKIYLRTPPSKKGLTYHITAWDKPVIQTGTDTYECGLQQMHEDPWGKYILDNDIDASPSQTLTYSQWPGLTGWLPLGWAGYVKGMQLAANLADDNGTSIDGTPFQGSLDGQGHTISNLYMQFHDDLTDTYAGDAEYDTWHSETSLFGVGLFGFVGCASWEDEYYNTRVVIKNVVMTGASIHAINCDGLSWGLLVGGTEVENGYEKTVVENCSVTGSITQTMYNCDIQDFESVGGILGGSWGNDGAELCGCSANLTLDTTANDIYNIGGLVGGMGPGKITNCRVSSFAMTLHPSLGDYTEGVGGCIGYVEMGYGNSYIGNNLVVKNTVVESVSLTFTDQEAYDVGGFVGALWMGRGSSCVVELSNCHVRTGTLYISDPEEESYHSNYAIGGFVGEGYGPADSIYVNGSWVQVPFTGSMTYRRCSTNVDINNVYPTEYIGGFIGAAEARTFFYDCAAYGTLSGISSYVGGFTGDLWNSPIEFYRCLYAGELTVTNNPEDDGYVRGFAGNVLDNVSSTGLVFTDCSYDSTLTPLPDDFVTGSPTTTLIHQSHYPSFDFIGVWDIDEGVSWPFLRQPDVNALKCPPSNRNPIWFAEG